MSYDPNSAKLIFLQAMELPTAVERAAFLDQACAGQPALKARVESLIRTADQGDSLLDNPASRPAPTQIASEMSAYPEISLAFLKPSDAPGCLGTLGLKQAISKRSSGDLIVAQRSRQPSCLGSLAVLMGLFVA